MKDSYMYSSIKQDSHDYPGYFITFEGGEGGGKSTHSSFLAHTLKNHGYDVVHLREPGSTCVGEQLRDVVLNPNNDNLCDNAELMIYLAARSQNVSQNIIPALQKGSIVICDRFVDSTIAYQAYGRGLSADFIHSANDFVTCGCMPDLSIFMFAGNCPSQGLSRATAHEGADRLEQQGGDFHSRVHEGFLEIAMQNKHRVKVIYSSAEKSQTARAVFNAASEKFPWISDLDNRFYNTINNRYFGNKHQ